jgi:hypothetical protein
VPIDGSHRVGGEIKQLTKEVIQLHHRGRKLVGIRGKAWEVEPIREELASPRHDQSEWTVVLFQFAKYGQEALERIQIDSVLTIIPTNERDGALLF